MTMRLLNPQQLPFVGQGIGRIGQVYQIMATPCEIDLEIWVLAFWSGVPQTAWSLFKPEPLDNVITRFGRPIGRHARYRFRAMERFQPTINPGTGLGWAAFRIIGFIEKAGWYFMIWDAATAHALNWTSLAYRWSGCPAPGTPYAHAKLDGLWVISPGQPNWVPMSVIGENVFTVTVDGIDVPPGYTANFTVQVRSASPTEERPGWITHAEIVNVNTGYRIPIAPGGRGSDGSGHAIGAWRDVWANSYTGEWELYVYCDGGLTNVTFCEFKAFGAVADVIEPDP